jgi:hypothetical protein
MASVSSGTRVPLTIRVFLASPGDVVDERARARKTLEDLQYNPLLRGKITVETVAWDTGAGTPMLASKTPQQAIAEGRAKPSECDIVIVIFWSRMGTPLPADYIKTYLWSRTRWRQAQAMLKRLKPEPRESQQTFLRRSRRRSRVQFASIAAVLGGVALMVAFFL